MMEVVGYLLDSVFKEHYGHSQDQKEQQSQLDFVDVASGVIIWTAANISQHTGAIYLVNNS